MERPSRFTLFPQLPTEIRLKVWHTYFESVSPSANFCMVTSRRLKSGQFPPFSIARPSALPLLRACRESRSVALAHPFNPEADILYVSDEAFECWSNEFSYRPSALAPRIKHLAFAVAKTESGLGLPLALRFLSALETISVVFSNSRGRASLSKPVGYPPARSRRGKAVVIRELLPEEAAALTVCADMHMSGWFEDLAPRGDPDRNRLRWEKTVAEYLEHVRVTLSRAVSGDKRQWGKTTPCWDEEKEELKLKLEARCLETVAAGNSLCL